MRLTKKLNSKRNKKTRTQRGGDSKLKTLCREYTKPDNYWGAWHTRDVEAETLRHFQEIFSTIKKGDTIILKLGANEETNAGASAKEEMYWFLERKINPSGNLIVISVNPANDEIISFYPFVDTFIKNSNEEYVKLNNELERNGVVGLTKIKTYYQSLAKKVDRRYYIAGKFPLTSLKSDINRQILDLFLNHQGPLFIYNSCCSDCFPSIKYLIDTRLLNKLETGHGGLVNFPSGSFCYPKIPIYPNIEEKCESALKKQTPEEKLFSLIYGKSTPAKKQLKSFYETSLWKKIGNGATPIRFYRSFKSNLLPIFKWDPELKREFFEILLEEDPEFKD
jgi:hypothetical protein